MWGIVLLLLGNTFISYIILYNILKNKYSKKIEKEKSIKSQNLELERLKSEIEKREIEVNQLLKEINEKQTFNSSLLKIREEELERLFKEKETAKKEEVAREVENWTQSAQEAANFWKEEQLKVNQAEISLLETKVADLNEVLRDFKEKQDSINQEILRAREREEKQYFYQVQIEDAIKRDLEVLNSIRPSLTKVDLLDKLVYTNYIKKSVDEMLSRILAGQKPSGIYKITRLKTGEIYIGKSVNVFNRLQQHCRSCFHCGTISHSKLHTTMEKDGIWNWTFELLEEIDKDKLTEREKYWINFYDTKKFGLNEREG